MKMLKMFCTVVKMIMVISIIAVFSECTENVKNLLIHKIIITITRQDSKKLKLCLLWVLQTNTVTVSYAVQVCVHMSVCVTHRESLCDGHLYVEEQDSCSEACAGSDWLPGITEHIAHTGREQTVNVNNHHHQMGTTCMHLGFYWFKHFHYWEEQVSNNKD